MPHWAGPLSPAEANIARVILDEIAAASEEDMELPMPRDARLRRIARHCRWYH